jgi:hypothetical protein
MSPSNSVAQLYSKAPGCLLVAFYDWQGHGGGILTRLHAGVVYNIYILVILEAFLHYFYKII